jgi:hypothetical protein
LTGEVTEPALEFDAVGMSFGCKTPTLCMIRPNIFGDYIRVAHFRHQPVEDGLLDRFAIEGLWVGARPTFLIG